MPRDTVFFCSPGIFLPALRRVELATVSELPGTEKQESTAKSVGTERYTSRNRDTFCRLEALSSAH
jgi:hypothetical protein